MTRGLHEEDGDGPEPPRVVSIVIACVLGALILTVLFGSINLLR